MTPPWPPCREAPRSWPVAALLAPAPAAGIGLGRAPPAGGEAGPAPSPDSMGLRVEARAPEPALREVRAEVIVARQEKPTCTDRCGVMMVVVMMLVVMMLVVMMVVVMVVVVMVVVVMMVVL